MKKFWELESIDILDSVEDNPTSSKLKQAFKEAVQFDGERHWTINECSLFMHGGVPSCTKEEQPVKEQGASAFRLIYHYSRLWPPAMHLAFVPMRHGFSLTNV
ncbi:hypothetical protein T03_16261 [Trichinella britovi]|uniref:Uncharacterized protein n=1 Tax=Trichinella britovi TaxID=45882 RepID=A0A0V1D090_TRIBR|nr:hypothetical protein T03_16261 [Trichinella britovi]